MSLTEKILHYKHKVAGKYIPVRSDLGILAAASGQAVAQASGKCAVAHLLRFA